MKIFVLFVIILFLVPQNALTQEYVPPKQTKLVETSDITPQQLSTSYSKLLQVYIQSLIREGETFGSNSLRWKKYLNLPWNESNPDQYPYSQYYFGLYYGNAGVGTLFLQLYEATNNVTYLHIAEKAGNYLLQAAQLTSWGYAWTRSNDSVVPYTSEKYGQAGISYFLLNLYQDSKNTTYLDYALSNLQMLYDFRLNTPFGYAFNYSLPTSAQITDYIYGATGVAKAYLTAYLITSNKTYLDICIKTMSWVLNQTEYTSLSENGLRKVLYSPDSTYWYFFTGYQSGAAGIGDFLLSLYNITKQSDYLLYAKQLANWLVYEENGTGIWSSYNAVDYLTDQYARNEDGTFVGYSAGSSGVSIFLMDLYQVTKDNRYLGPVVRAKDYLIKHELTNGSQIYWKVQINGTLQNRIQTGLSVGVAGVALFLTKYYHMFGAPEALSELKGINEFYGNITTSDGLVPYIVNVPHEDVIYDSTYLEGLTGIALVFLAVMNEVNQKPIYNETVLENIPGFTFTDTTNWIPLFHYEGFTAQTGTITSTGTNTNSGSSNTKTTDFTYLLYALVVILPITGMIRKKKINR